MALELFPGKHLFIDDHRIERLHGARRVLNPPQKNPSNPVLVGEYPWERNGVSPYRCLYDQARGVLRMWYGATGQRIVETRQLGPDNPPSNVYESYLCYAESNDGIRWQRPALGCVEYEGSRDNNIIIQSRSTPGRIHGDQGGLLIDDAYEQDPQRRYKMIFLDTTRQQDASGREGHPVTLRVVAHSADGIAWIRDLEEPQPGRRFGVLAYLDAEPSGAINPGARYIVYGQRGSAWKTRQIGRRDSDDLVHWSDNWPVLESSLQDKPGTEFYYTEAGVLNRTYAGLHLGALGVYYTDMNEPYHPARQEGLIEAQLAYSRDSVHWQRWDEPFIPRGEPGSFDWGLILCSYPAITADRLYFLYEGRSASHGAECPGTIGVAALRLDGFVFVEAEGFVEGTLTTRPHHWRAESLLVNVQAAGSRLRVQLQDETGRALPGYSCEECDPIREDALSRQVSWRGSGDLRALSDRMVAIQFYLSHGARLYSYTMKPPR